MLLLPQAMLNQLETRYYASPQLPQLTQDSADTQPQLTPEMQELYMLALQAPVVGPSEEGAAAGAAAAAGGDAGPGGGLGLG
jgi:hypothetical protein